MENNLINCIRERGHRITPLLRSLLDIFNKSEAPMSISDLISALRKKDFSPNKTTLYRQLVQLTQMDILQENIFSDTVKRYCLKYGCHHHHFICRKCGLIKNIKIDDCQKITAGMAGELKRQGYAINEHIMTFSGTCKNCLII